MLEQLLHTKFLEIKAVCIFCFDFKVSIICLFLDSCYRAKIINFWKILHSKMSFLTVLFLTINIRLELLKQELVFYALTFNFCSTHFRQLPNCFN